MHTITPIPDPLSPPWRTEYVCQSCAAPVRWDGVFEGAWLHEV